MSLLFRKTVTMEFVETLCKPPVAKKAAVHQQLPKRQTSALAILMKDVSSQPSQTQSPTVLMRRRFRSLPGTLSELHCNVNVCNLTLGVIEQDTPRPKPIDSRGRIIENISPVDSHCEYAESRYRVLETASIIGQHPKRVRTIEMSSKMEIIYEEEQ
mmetsp:Transcript_11548/g.19793  ORF Transcript_11548/g.19793 Transcript_11548/m.19793 type:complete len:157 (+) Transcript_11548:39-509(+)